MCKHKLYLGFEALKNNCNVIVNNYLHCKVLVSYESFVAIYDANNNIVVVNEYYNKYSKTTSKHINMFMADNCTTKKVIADNKTFETMLNNAFIQNSMAFESDIDNLL